MYNFFQYFFSLVPIYSLITENTSAGDSSESGLALEQTAPQLQKQAVEDNNVV
jgi:hypothetical protein